MRILLLLIGIIVLNPQGLSAAESVDELRTQIDGNRTEIQKIQSEIQKYEKDLQKVQGQKQTLQNSIYELDLSRKKTTATIQLTENKIESTQNTILTLAEQITKNITQIKNGSAGLAQALRRMNEVENQSFIEVFLQNDNLANAWGAVESLRQFQTVVGDRVLSLEEAQAKLEKTKNKEELEKRQLSTEKEELASNKRVLDINRNEKNTLLRTTKNQESEYQKILAEKRKAKEEFEAELSAFEARLKFVLDKGSLPTGESTLQWPLANVYITQRFGTTSFSQSGAYNGRGHNGVDFRAAVGTRVNAAGTGTVTEVGNTDAYAGCYSYGRWILINHNNGISTLYAHLSKTSVSAGDIVVAGQRIGYSGNTGYSTGPHLHFGTYATKGVRVVRMGDVKAKTNCTKARVPIAPTNAYLNPLDYL
jgi:murein DD-endopeptidase MepM/ murein hydrolase activator NlpD